MEGHAIGSRDEDSCDPQMATMLTPRMLQAEGASTAFSQWDRRVDRILITIKIRSRFGPALRGATAIGWVIATGCDKSDEGNWW